MSKVSFRTRQIDFNRSLQIVKYDSEQYRELGEGAFVNRGAPTVPSGMEREEENEHHFIEVLQALQMQKRSEVSIPVPEIIEQNEEFERTYCKDFVVPANLIHVCTAFLNDDEQIEYDMDAEDEYWLSRSGLDLTPENFEYMIERMERNCGQKKWLTLDDVKHILSGFNMRDIIAVYDYWLEKRLRHPKPLIPMILQEKRDGSTNDAYVAFRRRTERMQTRKNRKNEEYSYEKMLIFKHHNECAAKLPRSILKREMFKADLIALDRQIFQMRCKSADWDGALLAEADAIASRSPRSYGSQYEEIFDKHLLSRKRETSGRHSKTQTAELSDTSDTEVDLFPFIRLSGCKYQKPLDCRSDLQVRRDEMFSLSRIERVHRSIRRQHTSYLRQRCSRGGRRHFDRMHSVDSVDSYLNNLDSLSSLPPPETEVVELQHFPNPGISLSCNRSPPSSSANAPLRVQQSLSPTIAGIPVCFEAFLRGLSKDQLALCLSSLMSGRCANSGWSGSSGKSIYLRSPHSGHKTSVSACQSAPLGEFLKDATAACSVRSLTTKSRSQGVEAAPLASDGDNAPAAIVAVKFRGVAPPPLGNAAFTNGKVSANSSPKKALMNGGAPYVTAREDGTFPRLLHQVTPVRKSPLTMVKGSNSREDGANAASAVSTDEKSIIPTVVSNV